MVNQSFALFKTKRNSVNRREVMKAKSNFIFFGLNRADKNIKIYWVGYVFSDEKVFFHLIKIRKLPSPWFT